ncbi:MAG: GNAT family N-acetyltransferase [Rhodobacteraceae bacterium]|nr:GNAT family N-acetyltransferase [Paracoccaceae bacterium]
MPIVIRKAVKSDAKRITDLVFRSKRSNGYDDTFMDACREELTVTGAQLAGDFWVAEMDGLKGCTCLENGKVTTFFVAPECKRQGIGKLLWDELLTQARRLDLGSLQLDADPAAVPFYQSLGFTVIGEVPSGSIAGRRLPSMLFKVTNVD